MATGFFIGLAIGLFTMIPTLLMLNDDQYTFRVFRVSDPVKEGKLKIARRLKREGVGYVSSEPTNEDIKVEETPEISKDPIKFLRKK